MKKTTRLTIIFLSLLGFPLSSAALYPLIAADSPAKVQGYSLLGIVAFALMQLLAGAVIGPIVSFALRNKNDSYWSISGYIIPGVLILILETIFIF